MVHKFNITQNGEDGFDVLENGNAVYFGKKNECVNYVLQHGAGIDTVTADGWTAEFQNSTVSSLRELRIVLAKDCGLKVTDWGVIV